MMNNHSHQENYIGFLSYSCADNACTNNTITKICHSLENELYIRLGKKVKIFQDNKDIHIGEQYHTKIEELLETTPFFIPVLSPNYFKSRECLTELKKFLEIEKMNRYNDRILPIQFVDYDIVKEDEDVDITLIYELEKRISHDFRRSQRWHRIYRYYIISFADDLVNRIRNSPEILSRHSYGNAKSFYADREVKPMVPQTVKVSRGEFWMGSPPNDNMGKSSERPYHKAKIDYDLMVGIYPITFDEWDSFAEYCRYYNDFFEDVCRVYDERFSADKNKLLIALDSLIVHDDTWGRNKLPLINVSWYQAQFYTIGLSLFTNRDFRLLSETEWEYCCRAGSITRYAFGDDITQADAVYGWLIGQTTPVKFGHPNAFGLYHMHGQVWEWVEDIYHDSYDGAPDDGSPWVDNSIERPPRIVRGGSWKADPPAIRSAKRGYYLPDQRVYNLGFRIGYNLDRGSRRQ